MKNAKLEGMQKGGNMMKKVFGIMMVLVMMASFIAVPASAESSVTLLETWFEDADGVKVYDTSAAKTVNPVFYVNNSGDAAVTDANVILASYDADKRLKSVNYATAPEIPVGESRIEIAETVDTAVGGETYMMIWKDYDPVVEKEVLSDKSRQAEIISFTIDGTAGYIKEEAHDVTTTSSTYSREKSIFVLLPADSTVDLTAEVTPVITVPEGATISPASGTAVNFADGAVSYTVTAPDGVTTQIYTVTAVKSDMHLYSAAIGSDFPVISYDDVNAETAVTSKSDYGTIGTTMTNKIYSVNNSKWSRTSTGSNAALYYTRAQIEGEKYVLRDDEEFEKGADGNKIYYASTSATEPVASGSEANADICYVLKDNGDGTTSKVLTSDYVVCADPKDAENLVLRYDKRGAVNTTVNTISKLVRYTNNSSAANMHPANYDINVMKYSFDLYVPKTDENALYMMMGLYTGNSTSVPGFYLCFRRTGNTLEFLARNTNKVAPVLHTINNGLDKWHDIDVLITTDLTNKVMYLSLYIDNIFVAKTNVKNTDASFQSKIANNYDKHHMSFGAYGTEARGTFYIDNIDIEVETVYGN